MVEAIQLLRHVNVKVIVTENFKNQVSNDLNRQIQQYETVIQQIDFEVRRITSEIEKKATPQTALEAKSQIDNVKNQAVAEKQRLTQMRDELLNRKQVLFEMPVGSVVTQFTVESPVQVRLGDDLYQRLESGEILVKDNIIQEIKF